MRIILDTHAFLWWVDTPERLTETAAAACCDRANELVLSVASVWEIQIKVQLRKLLLSAPVTDLILCEQQENGLQLLPIRFEHVLAIDSLPVRHRDPFDRLLIAQASVEDAFILSTDRIFAQYPVKLLQ